jgi:hypothetical protein
MYRLLVIHGAGLVAAPAVAHATGGDNDLARIGFTDARLHVEWVWDGAPPEVFEQIRTWKETSTPEVYRGKHVTCSIADEVLFCAVEIDRKGKVRAPRYLLALGDVSHPTKPIVGQACSTHDAGRTTNTIFETPGVLIWAWIDGAKDDGEFRASSQVRCRTENAMGGKFDAACGFSFDGKGRVRAADPL